MNNIHYTFVSGYPDSEVKIIKKGVGTSTKTIDIRRASSFKKHKQQSTREKEQRMRKAYELDQQGYSRDEIAEQIGVTRLVVGKYINEMKRKNP